MFGLGMSEMVVIFVIALIVIGPKQLPEVAATIGRLINELKRATNDMTSSLVNARDETNRQLEEAQNEILSNPEQIENQEPPTAESAESKKQET
jgi:sec-independent protein translocase protein TatB